jgi:type 2 lantibiotic biosynthesis protein LanM
MHQFEAENFSLTSPLIGLIDESVRTIVGRSAGLYDRIQGGYLPVDAAPEALIERRLTEWCRNAASGDQEDFDRRLAWEGLDRRNAKELLGRVTPAKDTAMPGWAGTLAEVMQAASLRAESELTASCLDPHTPMPFEEVFLPFVDIGWREVERCAGSALTRVTLPAKIHLQRALLSQLTSMGSWALDLEFTLFRNRRAKLWRLEAALGDGSNRTGYLQFVRSLLRDGLQHFFEEYAVLGRLCATATDLWRASAVELLCRLDADWTELAATYAPDVELGLLTRVRGRLSDRHNGGRSVQLLQFASGLQIVYKPKCLDLELAFSRLLDWMEKQGVSHSLSPLRVLDRGGYGWAEFVEHKPLTDSSAARRYYERAGTLLCLAYLLEATDCHHENVIAGGEFPHLVDAETLFHHRHRNLEPERQQSAAALAEDRIWDSVLRTLFLPQWFLDREGNSFDVSGFAGENVSPEVPALRHMNSDHMHLVQESPETTPLPNQPLRADGSIVPAVDYVEEIVLGFRTTYEFLRDRRDALLAPEGPLSWFAHRRVRFVARPTRVYTLLLKKTFHPDFLRDGIDRSIQLDMLAQPYAAAKEKSPWWRTLELDHRALEILDIPFYWGYSDGLDLSTWRIESPGVPAAALREERFPDYFEATSYERALNNLARLPDTDSAFQQQLIRTSFYSHRAVTPDKVLASATPSAAFGDEASTFTPGQMADEAVAIADALDKSALRAPDGSITWMGMQLLMSSGRYQFQPVGESFFAGGTGIGLFLAAAARVTGEGRYRGLALSAVQMTREAVRKEPRLWARGGGMGGYSGAPSAAYALQAVGNLLGEEELLHDAITAALAVTPEQIAGDHQFDVIFGSAGMLLVLLNLWRQQPAGGLLELAIACGNRLLEGRTLHPSGHRAWETVRGRILTGFSHGATGIAYALLQLSAATGEDRFRDAAMEALGFERAVFLPAKANWPDLRHDPEVPGNWTSMTTWCHGAAGIALGRLASLEMGDDPEVRREAQIGVQTTIRFGRNPLDHLCCGNFGRASILHFAARKSNRPELVETALGWAAATCAEARRAGGQYALFWDLPRTVVNPGFMQGTAGIGYALLRLSCTNDSLPEPLILDANL